MHSLDPPLPQCTIRLDRLYFQQDQAMVQFGVSWLSEGWGCGVYRFTIEKAVEILNAAGEPAKAGLLQKKAVELKLSKDHLLERISTCLSEKWGFFKPQSNLPPEFDHFSIERKGWNYDMDWGCNPFAQLIREAEVTSDSPG